MRPVTVARSYAGALLELALRDGDLEGYAQAIRELAEWTRRERKFRRFLETPRVPVSEKKEALRLSLGRDVPGRFLRFLFVVLDKGRQRLLPVIASEFTDLLDERLGRAHVEIVLTAPPDRKLRKRIEREVEELAGQRIVPHYRVDPEILGGLVIRVGDRVVDGSLKRRLLGLRKMLWQGDRSRGRPGRARAEGADPRR